MKKTTYNKIVLLGILGMALVAGSCKKFLDQKPIT